MRRNDPDEYLLVPGDFEQPPKKGAAVMCACGVLEICACDGMGPQRYENYEGEK